MTGRTAPLLVAALAIVATVACTTTQAPDAGLYAALGDADVRYAATTVQRSLETAPDGEARGWRNPASGYGGLVRPVTTYVSDTGQFCRRYEETLLLGGDRASYRHEACRDADGYWAWQ
jgi:surface antigen